MSTSKDDGRTGGTKTRRWKKFFTPRNAPVAIRFEDAAELEDWIAAWLAPKLNLDADAIRRDAPFSDMGLDSMVAVHLSGDLERVLDREITPSLAWEYPTIAEAAAYLFSGAEDSATDMDRPTDAVAATAND
jgi:acyl carrier protein